MTAAAAALLAFDAGGEPLALDAAAVREIVNLPRLTRVPHAPAALAGVASIRGSAVPVLSVSALRGREPRPGKRVLILDREPPVGLLVDDVASMRPAGTAAPLDLAELLQPALRSAAAPRIRSATAARRNAGSAEAARIGLLIFAVGRQEFALPLDQVKETLAVSADIAPVPRSDPAVIGTMPYRDVILPVFSLGILLALSTGDGPGRGSGIVVALIRGRPVGLVVDELRSVVRISADALDPVPPVIARRSSEARITAICRLEGGRRLVSVLDAAQLVRGIEATSLPELDTMAVSQSRGETQVTDPFVVFEIGDQAFGLPAAAIEAVVRRPERLTKVPRSPDFVEGIMNLRGRVVPVIDQRARFGAASARGERDRVIIVSLGDLQAGFVVDHVRNVLRFPSEALTPAPEIAEGTKVFDRIATLAGEERIILLIDPAELLDEVERKMLTALRKRASAGS